MYLPHFILSSSPARATNLVGLLIQSSSKYLAKLFSPLCPYYSKRNLVLVQFSNPLVDFFFFEKYRDFKILGNSGKTQRVNAPVWFVLHIHFPWDVDVKNNIFNPKRLDHLYITIRNFPEFWVASNHLINCIYVVDLYIYLNGRGDENSFDDFFINSWHFRHRKNLIKSGKILCFIFETRMRDSSYEWILQTPTLKVNAPKLNFEPCRLTIWA